MADAKAFSQQFSSEDTPAHNEETIDSQPRCNGLGEPWKSENEIHNPSPPNVPVVAGVQFYNFGQQQQDWEVGSFNFAPPPPPPPTPTLQYSSINREPSIPSLFAADMISTTSNEHGKRPISRTHDSLFPPQAPKRPVVTRATCTHISMVKTYVGTLNPHVCHQCGCFPAIGFLYVCDQDRISTPMDTSLIVNSSPPPSPSRTAKKLIKSLYGNETSKEAKEAREVRELSQHLGIASLSKPTQDAIKRGEYMQEHIETFIAQKAHLMITISKAEMQNAESKPPVKKFGGTKVNVGPFALPLTQEDKANDLPKPPKLRPRYAMRVNRPCDHKVCHNCRPNSRDKTFVSFESVFNGEVEMPQVWDMFTMPVQDTRLVRNLGLRPVQAHTACSESPIASSKSSSPVFERPASWSPSSGNTSLDISEGERQSLCNSLLEIVRARFGVPTTHETSPVPTQRSPQDSAHASTHSSPSDTPTISNGEISGSSGVTREHTALEERLIALSALCTDETGNFDLNNWQRLSDEVLEQAAQLPLSIGSENLDHDIEEGELSDISEAKPVDLERENGDGGNTGDTTEEEETPDLELSVKGPRGLGLRLTEEAVETDSPDIIVSM